MNNYPNSKLHTSNSRTMHLQSPRARSRTASQRRSYSHSPEPRAHTSRRRHSRDRSYSRSRSPTPPPPGRNGRYSCGSRSSSRSLSPRRRRRVTRSRSRARGRQDKRRIREKPVQSRCIGVFGLSVFTTQHKIREIFSKFGNIERIQVVIDAQTGRSRGFCFIYYDELEDAKAAKEECSGIEIDERRIRVDYSITQRPHTPTPGVYMGRPTRVYRDREYHDRHREEHRSRRRSASVRSRRSASHYRSRRRHARSRSRSYTPPRRSRY